MRRKIRRRNTGGSDAHERAGGRGKKLMTRKNAGEEEKERETEEPQLRNRARTHLCKLS